MDSWMKRLKYYGIGFGMGLIFVVFFFQNRGCSWLPDNRVKNSILDRVLVLPEKDEVKMKSLGLTEKDLTLVLNDGKVVFDKSVKNRNPKVYLVEKEFEGKGKIKFFYTLPEESFISEIHLHEKNAFAIKNTKKGTGKLISFPKDDDLVFPDSAANVTCQQSVLKLINPRDVLKLYQKTGVIDFEKSHLNARPKAEHYLCFTDKQGRKIGSNVIWYKNKLNITSFVLPFKSICK
ncbi:MAG: hypothetical protein HYR91_08320 [Flavobacteriia bacterium]|nr:hypothetical protein [Flavobacteriia bacterium]